MGIVASLRFPAGYSAIQNNYCISDNQQDNIATDPNFLEYPSAVPPESEEGILTCLRLQRASSAEPAREGRGSALAAIWI
jgi:hypothetical protein